MLTVATIIGVRPQFIKASVISHRLRSLSAVHEVLIHTGQHYDAAMSRVFFAELGLPEPAYLLHSRGGSHGRQTAQMLEAIEGVLQEVRPHRVLVYGDTNSTLAGALAAAKLQLPVAHIESGLRCGNRQMPEEINRTLTDHLADCLFVPTASGVAHLAREGITGAGVHYTSDLLGEAVTRYRPLAQRESRILDHLSLRDATYILATTHRQENTDDPAQLRLIFEALLRVAREVRVIMPLHPRTLHALQRLALYPQVAEAITLADPLGYLDMLLLEQHADLIVTDSGSVQREAFFHRVPCLVLRREMEYPELVALGWSHLAPMDNADALTQAILTVRGTQGQDGQPFGEISTSTSLVDLLTREAAVPAVAVTQHDAPRVSPLAAVDAGVSLGRGVSIAQYTHVGAGTTIHQDCRIAASASIGEGVTLGPGVEIDHQALVEAGTVIGGHTRIGPLAALLNATDQRTTTTPTPHPPRIGAHVEIGNHATIYPGVTIADGARILPNTCVLEDVPVNAVVRGNPGRVIGQCCRCPQGPEADARCPACGGVRCR